MFEALRCVRVYEAFHRCVLLGPAARICVRPHTHEPFLPLSPAGPVLCADRVKEVYVWKDQGWYGLVDQRKIAESWFLESMVKKVHWDFFRG